MDGVKELKYLPGHWESGAAGLPLLTVNRSVSLNNNGQCLMGISDGDNPGLIKIVTSTSDKNVPLPLSQNMEGYGKPYQRQLPVSAAHYTEKEQRQLCFPTQGL